MAASVLRWQHMEYFNEPANASEPVRTGAHAFSLWLTVAEAVAYCQTFGLSRTQKTVRKWAQLAHQAGGQDDVKVRHQDTENGFRWLIERASLDVKIAQEKEYEARKAEALHDDAAEPVPTGAHMLLPVRTGAQTETRDNPGAHPSEPVPTGADPSAPVRTEEPTVSRDERATEMIDFLKNQIDEKDRQLRTKDDQIAAMLERDHETNALIHGLQNMLALRAPSESHGRREGDNSTQYDG